MTVSISMVPVGAFPRMDARHRAPSLRRSRIGRSLRTASAQCESQNHLVEESCPVRHATHGWRWMSRPIAPLQMVRHHAIFPPLPDVRRIAFTSKFATWHQNVRLAFEIIKNARADSPARTDSPPARIGFSRSRTTDAITAAPRPQLPLCVYPVMPKAFRNGITGLRQ